MTSSPRIAEYALSGRIEQHNAALPIDGQHRVLGGFDQALQPCLAAPHFRNIPDESGIMNFFVFRGRYLRDRQLERKSLAVLAPSLHCADAADGAWLAGLFIAGDIAVMLGRVGLGHEIVDLASDNLISAIAEDSFRGGIEQDDATAPVDGNNRVLSSIDKTLEPIRVAADFFQVAAVLDHLGKDVRYRLQKMNVVLRKYPRRCGMRSKNTEGLIAASDNDAHPAYRPVIAQQRRPAKSLFRSQIFDDHRLPLSKV